MKLCSVVAKVLIVSIGGILLPLVTQAQEKTPFDYMDVFELQYVSDPNISPDGNQIVYVRNQFDVMTDRRFTNLWIINSDGSGHQPLTSGKKNYGSPIYSPDGKRLAYISTEEGAAQIFVRNMSTGLVSSISNLTYSPSNISWSPDGQFIAFSQFVPAAPPRLGNFPGPPKGAEWVAPAKIIDQTQYKSDGNFGLLEPGFVHLFVISVEGGAHRQLTTGNYNHGGYDWNPDGKSIVVSANREPNADLNRQNTHLYKISLENGAITKLTSGVGPHNAPRVSPDGRSIAYTGYEDKYVGHQQTKLFVLNSVNGEKLEIKHRLDRDVYRLVWSVDGKSLFAQYDDKGVSNVVNISLDGRTTPVIQNIGGTSYGRPYSGGSFSINKSSNRLAYTLSSTSRPAELAVAQYPSRAASKQLTKLNEQFLATKNLGKVEELWYKSSVDNWEIQGWVIYPPDFDASKKYPLILEIHGGPYAAYGPHFSPELQLMAAKGYVVLYTNPRGSTSYGEGFAAYINDNYPSEDYQDLMSGIDYLISRNFIDEKNLFITGGSGGGVLTAWSISKTNRFAAAVVSKPVINWYSFVLTADNVPFFSKYWFNKFPWEDPKQYLDRSPISLVGNVKTPTLLVTGEQDYRTPMSETEQYYAALKLQGVETMMIRIQSAGHGLTARPSNMIRHVGYIVAWFDRYKS